jgi:hypothetical protein
MISAGQRLKRGSDGLHVPADKPEDSDQGRRDVGITACRELFEE